MKNLLISYHVLRQEAEAYLAERAWVGTIYCGQLYYDKVAVIEQTDDFRFRAAAPKNLTAEQVFCDIIENSDGEQFHMEHPDGSEVDHNKFKFKCTIKKVSFKFGGVEKKVTEVDFEGYHCDLQLSREDTLHNVEVIE